MHIQMVTRGPPAEVTEDKLLQKVQQHDKPFVTSTEMAEELGVERQTAYKHLERLREEGEIEKEKVGGSAAIYWLPERVN